MTSNEIARAAHAIIRTYEQAIGDDSQPDWEHTAEWLQAYTTTRVELLLAGETWTTSPHQSWLPNARDVDPAVQRIKDCLFNSIVREFAAPRREIG